MKNQTVDYKDLFETQDGVVTTLGRIRQVVHQWALGDRPPLDEETSDQMAFELLKAVKGDSK